MSITAVEKTLRKLPPKQLETLLVGTILRLPIKSRRSIFHDLHVVEEPVSSDEDEAPLPCCPPNWHKLPPEKKYNKETMKVLEESRKYDVLEKKVKSAKNEKERTVLQKELDAYGKKIGMKTFKTVEELFKDLNS